MFPNAFRLASCLALLMSLGAVAAPGHRRRASPPEPRIPLPEVGDTLINDHILLDALEAVESSVTIDTGFDIPYLAGYDVRGGKIYIDRRMPDKKFRGKDGRRYGAYQFLAVHEMIEKSILDYFKRLSVRMPYQYAHQMAMRAERATVEAAGVAWEAYNDYTMKFVETSPHDFHKIPRDLDLTPYVDEQDGELVKAMKRHMH